MPSLASLTAQAATGRELSSAEIASAAVALAGTEETDAAKADFLVALGNKGETPAEVAAFATAFRQRAVDPGVGEWSARAIDIVGTGGDHSGGFNISSVVTLVLASAGVPVMKHGNRGITSKCGSADLLAALGFDLEAPPEKMRAALHHSSAQNWAMDWRAEDSGMPWAEKDMTIVLAEADQARLALPLCGTIKEVIKGLKIRMGLGMPVQPD